ncbi:MAG: hypothetical protein ACTSQA_01130 [Candidatus Heimdallarchaeaceae archaeon]
MKMKIEWVEQCKSCKGTGLYTGIAEREGAGVICWTCKGTGRVKKEHNYTEFTGRKRRKDITRVFKEGWGYVIVDEDIVTEEGIEMPFTKFGCTYEEWLAGATPKELTFLICPHQPNMNLSNKSVDNCKDLNWGMTVRQCPHYSTKEKCWEEYENNE